MLDMNSETPEQNSKTEDGQGMSSSSPLFLSLAEQKGHKIIGPINFSTFCGFLTTDQPLREPC